MQHTPFSRLIGTWKTEGVIFDKQGNTSLSGADTYEWMLGGHYILHKAQVMMGDQQSETVEIVSAGSSATEALMQYYNSKGESGMETATLAGNVYRIEAGSLRFEGTINESNTEIGGSWTIRTEEGVWKKYITLKLLKQ